MLVNYLKTTLFISLIAIFSLSCKSGGTKAGDENDSTKVTNNGSNPAADVSAVCLWSSVTLRETPQMKGKYKNVIYLGEKAKFLGQTVTDSSDKKNKRDFIKIKLTDGKEGWVQSNMMAVGGKAYAIKDKTKLYKRPDILSVGKDEFDKMQFVVVTEEQGEWAKIKGKKKTDTWFKEGWVKLDKLAGDDVDVTVSIQTEMALMKETVDKKLEALKEITDNADFSTSIFISDVRAIAEGSSTSGDNKTNDQPPSDYIEGE
jgi:hypothetical protein